MVSVRRAVVLSMAQRYVAFVIQFVASIILARLLTPAETGIFSLSAAVIGIAQMLRDFGVGEYIVQERDLTRQRLKAALGLSIVISWPIAFLLLAGAHPVADFYDEAGVASVMQVLALNFLLLPFGSTTSAVLSKELAYNIMFVNQTLTALLGAVLCVALAASGFSYMSMAWASLASMLFSLLFLVIVRPQETLMLPSFANLKPIAKFGGTLTIGRLVDQLCRRAPDMLIAQGLGFQAVGLYSKASTVLDAFQDFFVSGISRVATPAFAKSRHENNDPHAAYLQSVQMLAVFPLCFFPLLGLLAEPLIRALFGATWMEAVPVIQIGAISGFLSSPYFLAPPLLTAHGRVKEILAVQLVGGLIFIAALALAAFHSLEAVAIAGTVCTVVKLWLLQRALSSTIGVRLAELLAACSRSATVGAIATVVGATPLLVYDGTGPGALLTLALSGVASVIAFLASIFLLHHPIAQEVLAWWKRRKG
ncbi:MAG: lipopolysaccharide biosynthesis protein [Moraxellaceae bacterium]|nr:lipopolysaccharide biosynthesis protein [Moraxellaceae bacterium]